MKAVTKVVVTALLIFASGNSIPAPTIPTIPAMIMLMTLGTLSQLNRSRVRGKAQMSVGMAKMPVYNIRQSFLSERAPRAIWPASN